jgi:urease accessory protein
MLSASKLLPQGRGLSPVLLRRAATVELDWEVRQKSRFDAVDSTGRTLGVFLPRGSVVRGSDVLVAEDGSLIVVRARPQPVMVVRACAEHGSPFDLLRAAYHLGNRHVAVEVGEGWLKLERDHVLGEMLEGLGVRVENAMLPFEPEAGAYAHGAASGPSDTLASRMAGHSHA